MSIWTKKKSKCCCIYEKPKKFGESSSEESEDECEHCHGRKDAHKKPQPTNKDEPPGDAIPSHPEPIATGGSAWIWHWFIEKIIVLSIVSKSNGRYIWLWFSLFVFIDANVHIFQWMNWQCIRENN